MLPLPDMNLADTAIKGVEGGRERPGRGGEAFARTLASARTPEDASASGGNSPPAASGNASPDGGKSLPDAVKDADSGKAPDIIRQPPIKHSGESLPDDVRMPVQAGAGPDEHAVVDAESISLPAAGVTLPDSLQPLLQSAQQPEPVLAQLPAAELAGTVITDAITNPDEAADTAAGAELAALALMLPPLATASAAGQASTAPVAAGAVAAPVAAVVLREGAGRTPGLPVNPAVAVSVPSGQAVLPDALPAQPAATTQVPLAQDVTPGTPSGLAGLAPTAVADAVASDIQRTAMALAPALSPDAAPEAVDALSRPLGAAAFNVPAPQAATAGNLPQTAPIPLPVTDPAWGDALGERVTWLAGQKIGNAEIRLNPVELGPVTVEIKVEDNKAHVTFTAQHGVTRDALEQALPRLRELLSGEGLDLTGADVNEQQAGGAGKDADGNNGEQVAGGDAAADGLDEPVPATVSALSRGIVDTFA